MTNGDGDERTGPAAGDFLDPDAILGVHVVRDADPATRARDLAEELGAEIVTDLDHAERAFAARAEAGRVEPVVLADSERAELVAQAEVGDTARSSEVTDSIVVELRQLAEELDMTARIRTDTELRFTENLTSRLAGGGDVAVHPETIRHAAKAVADAAGEVADCDRALDELGPRTGPHGTAAATGDDPTAATVARGGPPRGRGRLVVAMVVGTVFVVIAAVLLAIGVAVVVSAVVFAAGIVVAVLLGVRARRGRTRAGGAGASAAMPPVDDRRGAPGAGVAMSEDEWLTRRARLDTTRERAEERLRSARRHWESLVGPDADPDDVEGLLRMRDPQFDLAGAASATSPTVRTVSALHRRALARWRVAWAAVGYERPPSLADAPEHIEWLAAGGPKAGQLARERLDAAQAWADACATIDRPILLVNPENWLPPGRLASMVNTLPAGAEVVIVTR